VVGCERKTRRISRYGGADRPTLFIDIEQRQRADATLDKERVDVGGGEEEESV
jgi:hypothetical protein